MITTLIFDCFGVLTDPFSGSYWPKVPDEIKPKIRAINELADIGQISDQVREQRVAGLLDRIGLNGAHEIEQAYQKLQRREDLLAFIKKSRDQFKIGLLSNVADNVDRIFAPAERAELFDDEVLSYQVRLIKPNPEIYQLAARQFGVLTTECLFVDDKIVNIAAAKTVGMHGLLYQDFEQFRDDFGRILEQINA